MYNSADKTVSEVTMASKRSSIGLKSLAWWRRVSQLVSVAVIGQWSFYGIFRCPFVVPYVSCQNCPVITCHGRLFTMFWGLWLLLPLSVLFFGRAFCGWACPGGMLNQLLGKVAPIKMRLRNIITKTAPYLLLFASITALYFWLIAGQQRQAVPIRVGGFFEAVRLTVEHANPIWLMRSGAVVGFLFLGLLVANMWCRFFCPTGGVLEWLKPISLFKVYKTDRCNDCDKCLAICEMGTRPSEVNCTNCCDCLTCCPQGAIKIGRRQK